MDILEATCSKNSETQRFLSGTSKIKLLPHAKNLKLLMQHANIDQLYNGKFSKSLRKGLVFTFS